MDNGNSQKPCMLVAQEAFSAYAIHIYQRITTTRKVVKIFPKSWTNISDVVFVRLLKEVFQLGVMMPDEEPNLGEPRKAVVRGIRIRKEKHVKNYSQNISTLSFALKES